MSRLTSLKSRFPRFFIQLMRWVFQSTSIYHLRLRKIEPSPPNLRRLAGKVALHGPLWPPPHLRRLAGKVALQDHQFAQEPGPISGGWLEKWRVMVPVRP